MSTTHPITHLNHAYRQGDLIDACAYLIDAHVECGEPRACHPDLLTDHAYLRCEVTDHTGHNREHCVCGAAPEHHERRDAVISVSHPARIFIERPPVPTMGGQEAYRPVDLSEVNHGCPYCQTVFLVDPNNLDNVPPGLSTLPGGFDAFKAHLPACLTEHGIEIKRRDSSSGEST